MSSILKALKKIEQEESRGGKETHVWPNAVQSARQTVKTEGRKKTVLISLTLFCVFLAAGVIYLGSKMNRLDTPEKNTDRVVETDSTTGRQSKPTISPNPVTAKPPGAMSHQQQNQAPEKAAPNIEDTQPAIEPKKNLETPFPVMEQADSSASSKDDGLMDSDVGIAEPAVTDDGRALPEIKNDSRIKIQAIAWAEEPDRRFVVINNTIVKEGGSIDGITVVSIEDNIVLFNEGGNEWRQRFIIR